MKTKKKINALYLVILIFFAILFLAPIFLIVINSFKGRLYISEDLFSLPNATTFVGFENYVRGIEIVDFWNAFGYTTLITVVSVLVIVLFTSMAAWFITRVKTKFNNFLYYLFVFSMV